MPRLGRAYPVRPHLGGPVTTATLPFHYYRTSFPLTENPMLEGRIWTQGLRDGLDWQNIRTTANKAFGTQSGSSGLFDDSIAILTGTWGADQRAQATVFNSQTGGDFYAEVELHLRATLTANSAQGYEVLFSINTDATRGNYVEIVKWKGAQGQYVSLTGGGVAMPAVATSDVVFATIIGNTITAYKNGAQVAQVTDSTGLSGTAPYTSGNPGMGHWVHNLTQAPTASNYGFSDYMAETLDIRAWRQTVVRQAVNRAGSY